MLLIQTSQWFGPSGQGQRNGSRTESKITLESFATNLPLPQALALLREYSEKYRICYGEHLAVEHTLLGVQILPEFLDDDDLENARIVMIETMSASLDAEIADRNERGEV